jgi:3-oxoadipate enol-lactonase
MTKSLSPQLAYIRTGSGVPLVFLHGYPLDRTIWDTVTTMLEADFDVLAPDLRGFGASPVFPPTYALTDMAGDVLVLLNKLKLDSVVLAGHSMGGYVALALARAYPERVAGLALIASQAIADTPEKRQARYDTANLVAEQGVAAIAQAMPARLTPDERLHPRLKALISAQHADGVTGALLAMAERPDSTPLLGQFSFPTLILHGEQDALIPLEQARATHAAAPNSRLVSLPEAGHMPMLECARETAQALRAMFL